MDQNQISAYAKKLRDVLKVIVYMLRKGKSKLLVDLNLALKRGKIAGKSLIGKLSHHHHHHHHHHQNHPDTDVDHHSDVGAFNYPEPQLNNYFEFSCSNTPAHNNNVHNHNHGNFLSHVLLPSLHRMKGRGGARHKAQFESVEEEEVGKAFESALNDAVSASVYGSPVLPGFEFGRSPAPVRQLRVTDSPYPVMSSSGGDSAVVDAAAEEFIKRFYSQLKRQPLADG